MQHIIPITRRSFLVAALTLTAALALAACAKAPAGAALGDAVWQWTGLAGGGADLAVAQPANYTLQFVRDGTLAIRADCNQASGTYEQAGGKLAIKLGATTLAYCGDASLDQRYLDALSRVQSASVEPGELTLTLNDGVQMVFRAQ